ncbi:unnamed protein product [Choristocarpus tenellus]
MKKVSTGERVNFSDLRRSVGRIQHGDADSDLASEQMLVSELMNTTPSSSYEGDTWRDGYIYNGHDGSPPGSLDGRYDSDIEAADEVVSAAEEVNPKADLIVKEDVPEIKAESGQESLLSMGLAAVKISEEEVVQGGGG